MLLGPADFDWFYTFLTISWTTKSIQAGIDFTERRHSDLMSVQLLMCK